MYNTGNTRYSAWHYIPRRLLALSLSLRISAKCAHKEIIPCALQFDVIHCACSAKKEGVIQYFRFQATSFRLADFSTFPSSSFFSHFTVFNNYPRIERRDFKSPIIGGTFEASIPLRCKSTFAYNVIPSNR